MRAGHGDQLEVFIADNFVEQLIAFGFFDALLIAKGKFRVVRKIQWLGRAVDKPVNGVFGVDSRDLLPR